MACLLNVIATIKKLIQLSLCIAFFTFSLKALIDLLSNDTVFRKSSQIREPTFPSFTICPYSSWFGNKGFNKADLANGKMKGSKSALPWPLDVNAYIKEKSGDFQKTNLMNATEILNNFNVIVKWTFNDISKQILKAKN